MELNELLDDFIRNEILYDSPGFYNDPNFLLKEKNDFTYLEHYAEYVIRKEYTPEYIAKARREISIISNLLFRELESDGRLGGCIDMSGLLSKILEMEGYWNYMNKSSMTIKFPVDKDVGTKYFWPYDMGKFVAAHSYVVAPPFKVIDLTVRQQPYNSREKDLLPKFVMVEDGREAEVEIDDLISPNMQYIMTMIDRIPKQRLIVEAIPRIIDLKKRFPPISVSFERSTVKYIQYAILAPDTSLEQMKTPVLNGRSPFEVYRDLILPGLEKKRKQP